MRKFYTYVIYKLYVWSEIRDNTPVTNVILTLTMVHGLQMGAALMILSSAFPVARKAIATVFSDQGSVIIIALAFMLLNSTILFDRKNWPSYVKRYINESPAQRRRGTILVLCYLFGSALLFFSPVIIKVVLDKGN
jgi:hypothetical protein